ncbi:MAG: hypothetical protein KBC32_01010 [Candidatus Didemnitutus sp.]|nr:hypothetical protein [Candidatus Didemnitutus sp.]
MLFPRPCCSALSGRLWRSAIVLGALASGLALSSARAETASVQTPLSAADEVLLEDLQRTAFLFFDEQAHPVTGLVRDRARADGSPSEGKASIAASGFSLSAWVIAAERGWVTREQALARVRHKLRFLAEHAPREHGFFYHFMEMETGERAWKCELSSIDSALLFAGAIVAREYFADDEVTARVNGLLADVDWDWFRNGGKLVALGWFPETGFSRYRWDHFSEHVLMSFMALGVSAKPVEPAYWHAWTRTPVGRYGDYVYLQEPPLFVHQFPQGYLDLRDRRDAYANYFRNSQLATLAQRQFSIDLRAEFPLWGENLWGLTASDSAAGYRAWGGPPRTLQFNALDGTVVPCAPAGSLPFAPRETLQVLHHMRDVYGDRIWKRYGFVDAFNPHNGWVNEDVIGIDLGISLVQAENLRTGLIHRLFMQAPEIQAGLRQAGLFSTRRTLAEAEKIAVKNQAHTAWQALLEAPASPGLQITANLAAWQLGWLNEAEAMARITAALPAARQTAAADRPALFAAMLTARQALPALEGVLNEYLADVNWTPAAAAGELGSQARLAFFLDIVRGQRPAAEWGAQARTTQKVGAVHVLAPASAADAVLPGLWLDERAIVTGASAGQLAHARLSEAKEALPDAWTLVLLLDQFPGEVVTRPANELGAPVAGDADAQAALVITTANLLQGDIVRRWFQQDAGVQAARAAIAEFGEAAFGPNTSIYAQRELAGPRPVPPQRVTRAVSAATPRAEWDWQTVAGVEFKDSIADIRPTDAPVSMRFAFTWDETALRFHAEVVDTPPGYAVPEERNRFVEVFFDPAQDGFVWTGAGDHQFSFRSTGEAREHFRGGAVVARVQAGGDGYAVEAEIPWTTLGVEPRAGLALGVTPAVISEGTREWQPMLKLNWSYFRESASRARLGVVRLE